MDTPTRRWQLASIVLGLAAVAAGVWGTVQFQRAEQLTDTLKTVRDEISVGQSRLAETDARLKDAEARLSTNAVQLTEAAKPDLPVLVTFRPTLLNRGLVAVFKNTSLKQVEVAALFSSRATGSERRANLVLPPNGLQEIGYMQGWTFAAGQHISLTNTEYRPAEYEVPGT